MRKSICVLLALCMLFSLASCSGGSKDPAVGTWQGVYTKFVGDEEKNTAEEFRLELKAGGKGTHYRDDLEISVTWKLEGEALSVTESFLGMTLDYTGTLWDNVIHLFNGDPDDIWTCEYVYAKEGTDAAAALADSKSSAAADAKQEETGSADTEKTAVSGEDSLYDAGEVTVLVPAGWKAFPQHDVFSDDPDEMLPDVIRICKGGETDFDLYTKPSVQINYGGPSTTLMPPDKDWYDDTEDIDPIATGTHTWTGFRGSSLGSPLTLLFTEEGNIQYQATVWTDLGDGTISLEDADVQAILASVQPSDGSAAAGKTEIGDEPEPTASEDEPEDEPEDAAGEIKLSDLTDPDKLGPYIDKLSETCDDDDTVEIEGVSYTLSTLKTIYTALTYSAGGDYAWWSGDWYGWWVPYSCHGVYEELEDIAFEAFARITVDGETGHIDIWDTEMYPGTYLASCDVSFGMGTTDYGRMMSESGTFFDMDDPGDWLPQFHMSPAGIAHADWIVDPGASTVSRFDQMIEIEATYEDPDDDDNTIDYYIFLRPWGMEWDDVENGDTEGCLYSDMMPLSYKDWYLPLLEKGVTELPESFEAGWDLLD